MYLTLSLPLRSWWANGKVGVTWSYGTNNVNLFHSETTVICQALWLVPYLYHFIEPPNNSVKVLSHITDGETEA